MIDKRRERNRRSNDKKQQIVNVWALSCSLYFEQACDDLLFEFSGGYSEIFGCTWVGFETFHQEVIVKPELEKPLHDEVLLYS